MIDVSIHPAAEAEYEDALAWYYRCSPRAAARFETAFGEAIEAIRSHAAMYPSIDGRHRSVLVRRYPYHLVYRLDGAVARVVAVAHTRRRPGDWSGRA